MSAEWIYRAIQEGPLEYLRYGRRITVSRKAFEELGRRAAARHAGPWDSTRWKFL